MGHAFPVCSVLQFAVTAADLAKRAKVVALAEDKGEDEFPGSKDFICISPDDHPFGHRQCAGWLESSSSLNFDQTKAAAAIGCKVRMLTKRRYFYPGRSGSVQYRDTFCHFNRFVVDC
jgi:hypothetical protein